MRAFQSMAIEVLSAIERLNAGTFRDSSLLTGAGARALDALGAVRRVAALGGRDEHFRIIVALCASGAFGFESRRANEPLLTFKERQQAFLSLGNHTRTGYVDNSNGVMRRVRTVQVRMSHVDFYKLLSRALDAFIVLDDGLKVEDWEDALERAKSALRTAYTNDEVHQDPRAVEIALRAAGANGLEARQAWEPIDRFNERWEYSSDSLLESGLQYDSYQGVIKRRKGR